MSTLSQFVGCGGGGGTIAGEYKVLLNAPVIVNNGSEEWLRSGNIKAYDASYADAFAQAPQLGVFGSASNMYTPAFGAGNGVGKIFYVGTNYVFLPDSTGATLPQYSSSQTFATTATATGYISTPLAEYAATANGFLVAASGVGVAPTYSSNGSTFADVGGNWSAMDSRRVIVAGGGGWIALGSTGTAGPPTANYGFINNTNPSGTWTLTTAPVFGFNLGSPKAGAYGAGTFVVIASPAASSAIAKIFTIASPGAPLVDRTANLPNLSALDQLASVVFTGTHFVVAVVKFNAELPTFYRSEDGETWTISTHTSERSSLPYPITRASGYPTTPAHSATSSMATDGNGVLIHVDPYYSNSSILISRDHGLTWSRNQMLVTRILGDGGSSIAMVAYANGRWLATQYTLQASVADVAILDLGTTIPLEPNYMGQQFSYAASQYLRIK